MIAERMLSRLPIRSELGRLVIGSALVAVLVSLGMVLVLRLVDFSIAPVIPAAMGAIAAALYAATIRKR